MSLPKAVKVTEDEQYYILEFEGVKNEKARFDAFPDSRIVTMSIGARRDVSEDEEGNKQVDLSIAEISFPKQLYSRADIVQTANKLEEAIKQGECPPCVILSTTEKTHKTYAMFPFPTPKEILTSEEE